MLLLDLAQKKFWQLRSSKGSIAICHNWYKCKVSTCEPPHKSMMLITPMKPQTSLHICSVLSEPSLLWDLVLLHANNKRSDQPAHLLSLISTLAVPYSGCLIFVWQVVVRFISYHSYNCSAARYLIFVYLTACTFIRSWWLCTFWMTLNRHKKLIITSYLLVWRVTW